MANRRVNAGRNYAMFPSISASKPDQWDFLIDLALTDHGFSASNYHSTVYFNVTDEAGEMMARKWLQVGFFFTFAGIAFVDDSENRDGPDWAWVALSNQPIGEPPIVYFEQENQTPFPPRAIMTVDELKPILREWFETGERPTCVQWLTVNSLSWKLDGAGDIIT